jgi:superfamily II DNA helicase RecQ
MQIQIFNVPLTDAGESLAEMNRFLAGHKVLEVEQRFFQNEKGACWSFCVRYLPTATNMQNASKEKVDYKQVLSEAEFAIFSKLREIRKQIAITDAVPAYAVFTDEELAGITKLPIIEENKLMTVKGIGEKKVAKYGKQMMDMLNVKTGHAPSSSSSTALQSNL